MGHAFQQTLMDVLIRYHRMCGRQHAVAGRHRSRRHRDADRRREPVEGRRQVAAGPRPGKVHRKSVGVETGVRIDDHQPDAAARRVVRLVARALHDGRRPVERGDRDLCAALRGWPDLPRQATGQLGPEARHRGLRSRGRERGSDRQALGDPLPARRRLGSADGGDDASGDDAGRRRGRGQSGRHALRASGRQGGGLAAGRAKDPGHRRQLRRQGIRHRRGQDHAGTRLQRLGRRPAARPRADHHFHAAGDGERQRAGEVSRPRSLRRAQAGALRPRGRGTAGRRKAAQDGRAALRAQRRNRRADADRSVVRRDDQARAGHARLVSRQVVQGHLPAGGQCQPARSGRRRAGVDPLRARALDVDVQPLARQRPRLVHFAPALVGPSHPGVVRRCRQGLRRA